MARRNPQPTVLPRPSPTPGPAPDDDGAFAARLGERFRRLALGLAAALVTARAFWPTEPDFKGEAGAGLGWDLAVLIVAGLALASALIGGTVRIRWSWADAGVLALTLMVGLSTTQAHDRRPAINLAWDWGAIGLLYVLFRNLPRTAGESRALAGALVATAVAVAAYGLYQVGVELPQTRAHYLAHRLEALRLVEIEPGSPAQTLYEKRLLDSNEPMSTFALTNSLAGYLVGPLVLLLSVGWENLLRRDARGSRLAAVAAAALPGLTLLVCLLLTKSRSAYVGLVVAVAILAWRERGRVRARTLAVAGFGGLALVGVLVAAGLASGRLDREVLTESTKSLRYRWEYWVGAWRVITERPQVFWNGHGPGNFTAPYLKHKLPQSSEEISDPHNMLLEVWATAGAPALAALVAALVLALIDLFGRARRREGDDNEPTSDRTLTPPEDAADPPRRSGWLVACAGGGWLAVVLLGKLNPFEGDLFSRWLILGGAWLWAILSGLSLWRRVPLSPAGFGAAAVAMSVNLLAAGGIGFAAVALMLWTLVALGLNLRDDRDCGRVRQPGGRLLAFGLALAWAALLGSFAGAIGPFWRSEAAIARAEAALRAHPPQFEKADLAFQDACNLDKYSARPWKGIAYLKYNEWTARGAKVDDQRWKAIPFALAEAVKPPRSPDSWSLHRERAMVTRQLLQQLGSRLKPGELLRYRANVVEATRRASRLYPSNATLHAQLAQASSEIGMYADAVDEGGLALKLDKATPHLDKKLAEPLRKSLQAQLPRWKKAAPGTPSAASLATPGARP